jgi:RNA polymerase sigma-32 factor
MQLSNTSFSLNSASGSNFIFGKLPILTKEQEFTLGREVRDNGTTEAVHQLSLSGLRYVTHVAKSYSGYGLPEEDLIQEGNIGLLKAIKRYDPDFNGGIRLISFAVFSIKSEIHEYVLKNCRVVKIATTKSQRKLFFNLRKMTKNSTGWLSNQKKQDIAESLNVSLRDVTKMESRLRSHDTSYGATTSNHEGDTMTFELHNEADNFEESVISEDSANKQSQRLTSALHLLNTREQYIIKHRWLSEDKVTLETLGEKYSISKERVRQVEKSALNKIKEQVQQL